MHEKKNFPAEDYFRLMLSNLLASAHCIRLLFLVGHSGARTFIKGFVNYPVDATKDI